MAKSKKSDKKSKQAKPVAASESTLTDVNKTVEEVVEKIEKVEIINKQVEEAVEEKNEEEVEEKVDVSDEEEEEVDEELIPLEDLQELSADEGEIQPILHEDAVPVQKVTKNNKEGLLEALNEIKLKNVPWIETLTLTAKEPLVIKDIHNDLDRELAFYNQALLSVEEAKKKFQTLGLPFFRPDDYFAEMVKSDEHMSKIRQKILDESQSIKASETARKQRDLKKFGKQVQVEKIKERHLHKRQELEKIKGLKRKLKDVDNGEDFDIDLDDEPAKPKKMGDRKKGGPAGNNKRAKKDEKFGFGGKKRGDKRNTRESTNDVDDFQKKSGPHKGGAKKNVKSSRPGKARRKGAR